MKRSSLWLCMFGIVLWVGVVALAQGNQGQGGAAGQVPDRNAQSGGAQNKTPTADANSNARDRARALRREANAVGAAGAARQEANAAAQRGRSDRETPEKLKAQGAQQTESLKKQLQESNAKHMERLAKLNRIREIAVKENNKDMIARVDKLIAKENEVYGRKQSRMQGQPRATGMTGPNEVGSRRGAAGEQPGREARPETRGQKTPEANKPQTR